jgi:fructose-bisphosphate aldolase class I
LVPIIEPEILMDGDHDIDKTAEVQEKVVKAVYRACEINGVLLEGTLLKPSMTVPGADCEIEVTPKTVAEYTIRTMLRSVPASVPGIVFLSGGLSEEAASVYLNEMNNLGDAPWNVSFSYGRALQHSALRGWGGGNIDEGQKFVLARAQANSEASKGEYVPGSQVSSDEKLHIAGYTY